MNFLQYGAGNIGRGFIGQVFSDAGYSVQFVDVNTEIISALNTYGRYPINVLSNDGSEELWVENVSGIDGMDSEKVALAIANTNLMATAVGVNILPRIVPNIVAGIKLRIKNGNNDPLNIIICENLIDADKLLRKLITENLDSSEKIFFENNVGLVEASIGRMVPIMTDEMKMGNVLRVCVERYHELPIDKNAFKGEIPFFEHLHPYSPFEFYIKRKLYLHNMGHCLTAFLGELMGVEYIWQAIGNPNVKVIVQRAMTESALALSNEFGVPTYELMEHVADLMLRFANEALGDTCERVGKDITRKLSPNDRFVGAARLIDMCGFSPVYVSLGISIGLFLETKSEEEAMNFLLKVSNISSEDCSFKRILGYLKSIREKSMVEDILRLVEVCKYIELSEKTSNLI